MKLAVCGKGGSGKSTVTAILANEFQRRGRKVIVVDSDESNSGLHWMLGIETPPQPLMTFVGGKKKVISKMASGFSLEGGESALSLWQQKIITMDRIPAAHKAGSGACQLVVTGKIDHTFEGCACPMGVVTREFLKKLAIEDNQVVLVDMEAGVEHFGRGIETSLDAVLAVVEPSLESLNLAAKTQALTHAGGAAFAGAVLNKVRSAELHAHLSGELNKRNLPYLGSLGYYDQLVENGLSGRPVDLRGNVAEAADTVDRLLDFVARSAV